LRDRSSSESAFALPALKRKNSRQKEKIISSVGNKFTSRMARTKGKIESNLSNLERTNFDFYFDGSTGDISYFDIEGEKVNTFSISNFKCSVLNSEKNLKIKSRQNIINNIIVELTANYRLGPGKKNNIDFIIMSYSENGVIKNEGLAHINNESRLRYIYNLTGVIGEISFHLTPVYKNGIIGNRIYAETKYFNSEGDMINVQSR
jgi:hypothetical protein